jgi:hypothetical protein
MIFLSSRLQKRYVAWRDDQWRQATQPNPAARTPLKAAMIV